MDFDWEPSFTTMTSSLWKASVSSWLLADPRAGGEAQNHLSALDVVARPRPDGHKKLWVSDVGCWSHLLFGSMGLASLRWSCLGGFAHTSWLGAHVPTSLTR